MREGRKGVPGNTCLIEVRRRTCILQLYVIQSIYTSSRSIVTPARRSMCSALSLSLSVLQSACLADPPSLPRTGPLSAQRVTLYSVAPSPQPPKNLNCIHTHTHTMARSTNHPISRMPLLLLILLLALCMAASPVLAFGAGEIPAYSALSKTGALVLV